MAAPMIERYVLDEQGAVRKHVAVFVNNQMIARRNDLSQPLAEGDEGRGLAPAADLRPPARAWPWRRRRGLAPAAGLGLYYGFLRLCPHPHDYRPPLRSTT